MHDCTSEHGQGFAAGMRVSWHHSWATCHGFHVTVLVKTCCCSSTVGHPQRALGYRELGTPTPICHLMWSVDKVFGNGWLGSQDLRLNVYISYYNPPLLLFCSASFFLKDKPSYPGSTGRLFACLQRCGVTHVWHYVLAAKSSYSWSCSVPCGVLCSLNNHCTYS